MNATKIAALQPGASVTLSETPSARVVAERSADGRRVRFVRETLVAGNVDGWRVTDVAVMPFLARGVL